MASPLHTDCNVGAGADAKPPPGKDRPRRGGDGQRLLKEETPGPKSRRWRQAGQKSDIYVTPPKNTRHETRGGDGIITGVAAGVVTGGGLTGAGGCDPWVWAGCPHMCTPPGTVPGTPCPFPVSQGSCHLARGRS